MVRSALIAAMLSALLHAAAVFADPIAISTQPSEASISEREILGIDIIVSGVPEFDAVSGFDLTLAFDPGILALVDAAFGDSLGDGSLVDDFGFPEEVFEDAFSPGPGLINIAATSQLLFELFDLQPPSSDVLLATLFFEGIGIGEGAISFLPGIIINDFLGSPFLGGDLPASGSRITVTEAVAVSEPGTLALMAFGLALLLFATRRRIRTSITITNKSN